MKDDVIYSKPTGARAPGENPQIQPANRIPGAVIEPIGTAGEESQQAAGGNGVVDASVATDAPPASSRGNDLRSPREQEVLKAVLDLMVEEGDGFSMASVAARASCSKETLYRWFGDRDGLLTATVRWQASKVIMPKLDQENMTHTGFRSILTEFAASWISVLTGDVSVALNRLAVSHAGNGKTNLGRIVLENGPLAMRKRLLPIFALARENGFIDQAGDDAFRLFFGLVVADTQIRCLLGEDDRPSTERIGQLAQDATSAFLAICGTGNFQNNANKQE